MVLFDRQPVSSPTVSDHRLRRAYTRWLPLALGLTVAANLVVTSFLPRPARSIRRHADGSLTHLVHTDQSTVDRRYGLYLELGDAADGDVLLVPLDSLIVSDIAEGLAGVTVEERDYDAGTLPVEAEPAGPPLGVFTTERGDLPYWILPDNEADRWWLAQTSEGIVVVPESVAPLPGDIP